MWFKLTNADFSGNNLGTISSLSNSWSISKSLGTGATYSGPTSVSKGAALSATVTIASGYEIGSAGVTVTMGGVTQSGAASVSGSTVTVKISAVTGNVVIKVPTKNTSGDSENNGSTTPSITTTSFAGGSQAIVQSMSNMSFVAKTAISGNGISFSPTTGRAASETTSLAVTGGSTVTLKQPISGVTLTYALVAYSNETGDLASAEANFCARAWISTSTTLPSNTKYVIIAFKRGDGDQDFSSSEVALLNQALTFS